MSSPNTVVNITNNNENKNTMNVTFDSVRKTIDSMTSLPEEDIEEIKNKISALEEIVNSKESKSKKWSKAKDIIKCMGNLTNRYGWIKSVRSHSRTHIKVFFKARMQI